MLDDVQKKLSPVSESAIYILLCLYAISNSEEGIHAYGIKRWLRRYTEKAVELPPSTIYKVLERFLAAGIVTLVASGKSDNDEQKYYAITEVGTEFFRYEYSRLEKLYNTVKLIIDGDGIKPTITPW